MTNLKKVDIDSMLIAIGQLIKEQKGYLGLTVAELSKKSGVSVGVISDLINNRGRVPSLANFINLAIALELPEDMFTALLQGNIEYVQNNNNCTSDDVELVLRKYGLSEENIEVTMIQINALIEKQCSPSHKRRGIFNSKD